MGNVTGMAKSSARSSLKLFIGISISSIITAVSVIVVMNLLEVPDAYGLVGISLIFPTLLSLFKDWGINSAMVKYLAQYRSENNTDGVKNVMITGLVFELLTGALLTLLCFFLAGFLATTIFEIPETKALIEFASLTILADSFLKISQSTFIGFERLEFHSLTQILNSVIRCSIAPLLVWLNFGVLGAIQGQIIAQLVAGLVGLLIFYTKILRRTGKQMKIKLNIFETLKILLRYSLPLSVSIIAGGFLPQFYTTLLRRSVVLPSETAYEAAMGNYGAAINFVVIISFFTIPIGTVLFPAFSKLKTKWDKKSIQVVFQSSVKYGALLTLPVTVMIMVLSEPLVFTLVSTEYTDAPFVLTLYAIIYLYAGLGNLSLGAVLHGQGRTDISMKMSLVTLSIGLVVGVISILPWGVLGLLVTNTVAPLPSILFGLWWVKKNFGATVDWMASAKILLASCIAAAVTYLLLSQFTASYWIELAVGGVCFLGVYLVAAPLIRAVEKDDVHSLREMLSGLGPLSYIFNIPLTIIEKLLGVFKS